MLHVFTSAFISTAHSNHTASTDFLSEIEKKKHLTIFCEAERVCEELGPEASGSPSVCLVSSETASVAAGCHAAGQMAETSETRENKNI